VFSVSVLGLILCKPGAVNAEVNQLTDANGCGSFSPSSNADGDLIAFSSVCDLTGSNADGNREIFQVDLAGTVSQLTDTTGCINSNPSSDSSGEFVSFESDCDPLGSNADGNVEVFQVRSGVVAQLTTSALCNNFEPSSNLDGSRVFFDSDCDFTGENVDGSNEIFRVDNQNTFLQYTNDTSMSFCGSFSPSSDGAGMWAAFESDCDPSGDNVDQVTEIFRANGAGTTIRLTFGTAECSSTSPSISQTGLVVAFESDCDPTGENADGGFEVFTVDSSSAIVQITDDPGVTACESSEPHVNADGGVLVFSSFCDLTGANADQSFEVFSSAGVTLTQVTNGVACQSISPTIDAGGIRVAFGATCDPAGSNSDANSEIFSTIECACGRPLTRGTAAGGLPAASDALFVLRSAVGQMTCALCDCDVNSSSSITSSDALLVLQAAVGQGVVLTCP